MDELFKIESNEKLDRVVSGRDLHSFLEIKARYNDWFPRMCAYGFEENRDYTLVTQKRLTNNPKNPWTEITNHMMTLDMAKEIAIIQRNEKGKQAREYFIQAEKAWNTPEKVFARAMEMADKLIESQKAAMEGQQMMLEVGKKEKVEKC